MTTERAPRPADGDIEYTPQSNYSNFVSVDVDLIGGEKSFLNWKKAKNSTAPMTPAAII